jgi:hypothetical protein
VRRDWLVAKNGAHPFVSSKRKTPNSQ